MSENDLKRKIMELAGWLAPFEAADSKDLAMPMHELVERVFSDPEITMVRAALIALAITDAAYSEK